jgi:site-specific recombinase XerC
VLPGNRALPALIVVAGERAASWNSSRRTSAIRLVGEDNRVPSITAVQPLHVSAWIEMQTREHAAPTVKLRLAALRRLFDWLVTGQVIPTNPAGSVRGPSHVVKAGKTPVLAPEEARALIDSIDITTHCASDGHFRLK